MTSPNSSAPSGAYVLGSRYGQNITESSAMAVMTGRVVSKYSNAQEQFKDGFANNGVVLSEVGRLDNRIDDLYYDGKTILSTYSTSGVWNKPPNCLKVVVYILGGASGGGCGNSSSSNNRSNYGLGGFSGGWIDELELNPFDLPDQVQVVVGSGGLGASTMGAYGGAGGNSSFNGIIATGARPNAYGTGDKPFRIRGGRGGYSVSAVDGDGEETTVTYAGAPGGAGTYGEGGRGSAAYGVHGGSGVGLEPRQIGMGSAGGGGYRSRISVLNRNAATSGGGGGWPSGPGGGGGAGQNNIFGAPENPGNGGSGATGAVFVVAHLDSGTP